MMIIEGFMFAIMIATYFYLRTRSSEWPPGLSNPAILFGTINTAIYLLSIFPNHMVKKAAEEGQLGKVRILLTIMSGVAVLTLIVRVFEFPSLNSSWDSNAYASVIWTLLGLHTAHLLTDAVDTWVLNVLMFTDKVEGKRFMDVSENADYWYFVILSWLPIYGVIYWAPRIL
jgi:cytochrome c oxidase subunit III